MPDALNVAVIGCGYWGPNLVRNFDGLPDVRVKTVCDLSEQRLAHIQSRFPGVQTTREVAAVTADPEIDAVAVATPVATHAGLAERCLEAGKHVIIEKPMARSSQECRRLMEAAEARGLTLMVGHTFIYSTPVRKIREIVDSGEIGDIYYISTQRLNLGLFQQDINVAWDLAPHDLSIILYLLGQTPSSVCCQGKSHVNPRIEDITVTSLQFPQAFATIHSSWLDPNKVRRTTIVGSRKMIVYDDTEPLEKIRIYDKRVEAPPHYDTYDEFQYSYHYGDSLAPYLKCVEPLRTQCAHFVESIRRGSRPETCGADGLEVVRILEAASQSLRQNGTPVQLDTAGGESQPLRRAA